MISPIFDIGLVIIIATIFAYFARGLRQPLIVGYVLAGVLIGPLVLGLITSPEEIAMLSELGIAFLLFTVGLEIDIQKLRSVGGAAVIGGLIQVVLTFMAGFWFAGLFGFGNLIGIYLGLLFAFSSTMIVAKILADTHEIGTLHGRIMLGILIVQDIIVVLAIPFLSNISSIFSAEVVGLIVLKGLGLFCIGIVLNRFVFTRILNYAARSKEVLFLTSVSTCFLFIGFAHVLGFSIAIGAFIGGLAMAQFPYNIEVFGEMRSLRDFFSVLFFTSLGMQLNLFVMYSMFIPFIIFLLAIILLKPFILSLIYMAMGYGGRTASAIGLGLGQASEFTFIIAAQGLLLGHLSQDLYSLFLSLIVVTIIITPYLMKYHYQIDDFFGRFGIAKRFTPHHVKRLERKPEKRLENHIVVFGHGVMGEKVINSLKEMKKRFVVIDHDPDIVRKLNKEGIYCLYGEADNGELLSESGIFKAKTAIFTIPDIEEASLAIRKVKRRNKKIKVYARAISQREEAELKGSGADVIIIPKQLGATEVIRRLKLSK